MSQRPLKDLIWIQIHKHGPISRLIITTHNGVLKALALLLLTLKTIHLFLLLFGFPPTQLLLLMPASRSGRSLSLTLLLLFNLLLLSHSANFSIIKTKVLYKIRRFITFPLRLSSRILQFFNEGYNITGFQELTIYVQELPGVSCRSC